ncbi:MAG: hypothetical protein RBS78_08550 [Coriobacteriia bacterium]|nr:hypothetical protein [Coriobacteriia bacterium]
MVADRSEWALALSKGAIGTIPLVGPLAAEVVGVLIPNQRLERIERFLEKLEADVSTVDRAVLESKFHNPSFVDLLEDSFYQAARALSEERLQYIACLVAEGVSQEDEEYLHLKKMLSILGNLNDAEILFLVFYGKFGDEQRAFMEQHKDVLYPKWAAMQSSDQEHEAALLQSAFKSHLAELGLLKPRFKKPRRGELPEFDEKTGMIKATGYDLTALGRMLLKYIGQPAAW